MNPGQPRASAGLSWEMLIGATPRAAQRPLLALSVLRRCPWRCSGGWKPSQTVARKARLILNQSLPTGLGREGFTIACRGGPPWGPTPCSVRPVSHTHSTPHSGSLCPPPILHMPPADAGGPPAQAPAPSPSVSPSLELGFRSSWAEGRRGCGAAVCRELRAHSCVRAWQEVFAGAVGGAQLPLPTAFSPVQTQGGGTCPRRPS